MYASPFLAKENKCENKRPNRISKKLYVVGEHLERMHDAGISLIFRRTAAMTSYSCCHGRM